MCCRKQRDEGHMKEIFDEDTVPFASTQHCAETIDMMACPNDPSDEDHSCISGPN
jgi:hypothetical protein